MVKSVCRQNHKKTIKCSQKNSLGSCQQTCGKVLECGHPCKKLCFEPCTTKCKYISLKTYPCGHTQQLPCHIPIKELPCDYICRSPLACGQFCTGKCSDCSTTLSISCALPLCSVKHYCGEKTRMSCLGLTINILVPLQRANNSVKSWNVNTEKFPGTVPCLFCTVKKHVDGSVHHSANILRSAPSLALRCATESPAMSSVPNTAMWPSLCWIVWRTLCFSVSSLLS